MSNRKEVWKKIKFHKNKPSIAYAVSNHGRFGVMGKDGKVEVRTFKPQDGGYRYNYRSNGASRTIFITRAIAHIFVKGESAKKHMVIHKDHDFLNDHADNLVWVTPEEHRKHVINSPAAIKFRKKRAIVVSHTARIFDENSIKVVKSLIWDPKRTLTLKQIAKKYKVSEMQIYRIKRGEIWFHVRVAGEPVHKRFKENLANIAYQKDQEKKARNKSRVKNSKSNPKRSANRSKRKK
jgi:hypothetical protein